MSTQLEARIKTLEARLRDLAALCRGLLMYEDAAIAMFAERRDPCPTVKTGPRKWLQRIREQILLEDSAPDSTSVDAWPLTVATLLQYVGKLPPRHTLQIEMVSDSVDFGRMNYAVSLLEAPPADGWASEGAWHGFPPSDALHNAPCPEMVRHERVVRTSVVHGEMAVVVRLVEHMLERFIARRAKWEAQ